MCSCTECVNLHTLHCLLQAKHGVMYCQFAIDMQHYTRAVQAAEKARGWAAIAWHPKPLLAIMEGTCVQWRLHAVLHWECQTLQCSNCKEYPVLKEEAQEDAAAEDISLYTYKYNKVSLRKDGKERRRLELVQKHTNIGEFHCLYYWPALGRGRYHSTCYMLTAHCQRERRMIMHGASAATATMARGCRSLSTRRFKVDIFKTHWLALRVRQLSGSTGQVQCTPSISATGQMTPSRMPPQQCKICTASCALTETQCRKGTDGTATSYRCGKSIYSQGKLLAKLHITINAQVKAPMHRKWWLNGKTGWDKQYCQQCMCCIMTPETTKGEMQMLSAKWIECDCNTFAMSSANECVCLLSNPACLNSVKSKGMRAKCKG
jgi:hypothetical protein